MTYEVPADAVSVWVLVEKLTRPFTASAKCFGARCEYRRTIVRRLCPSSAANATGPTPVIVQRLAKVCRRSWNRKFSILAAVTADQPRNDRDRVGVRCPAAC